MSANKFKVTSEALADSKQALLCTGPRFLTSREWNGIQTKKSQVELVIQADTLLEFTRGEGAEGMCLQMVPIASLSFVKKVENKFKFRLYSQHFAKTKEPAWREYQVASLRDLEEVERWIQSAVQQALSKVEPLQPWYEVAQNLPVGPTPSFEVQRDFVAELMTEPLNKQCSECCVENPAWCSMTFGTLFCDQCAGAVRSLPAHLVRVRSLHLDTMDNQQRDFLRNRGNAVANPLLESNHHGEKPRSGGDGDVLHRWVQNKYMDLAFVSPSCMDEVCRLFGLNGHVANAPDFEAPTVLPALPQKSPGRNKRMFVQVKTDYENEPQTPYGETLLDQARQQSSPIRTTFPARADPSQKLAMLSKLESEYLFEDSSDEEDYQDNQVENAQVYESVYQDVYEPVFQDVSNLPPLPPRRATDVQLEEEKAPPPVRKPRIRLQSSGIEEVSIYPDAAPVKSESWSSTKLRPKRMESVKSEMTLPECPQPIAMEPVKPPTPPPQAKVRPVSMKSPVKEKKSFIVDEPFAQVRPSRQSSITIVSPTTTVKPRLELPKVNKDVQTEEAYDVQKTTKETKISQKVDIETPESTHEPVQQTEQQSVQKLKPIEQMEQQEEQDKRDVKSAKPARLVELNTPAAMRPSKTQPLEAKSIPTKIQSLVALFQSASVAEIPLEKVQDIQVVEKVDVAVEVSELSLKNKISMFEHAQIKKTSKPSVILSELSLVKPVVYIVEPVEPRKVEMVTLPPFVPMEEESSPTSSNISQVTAVEEEVTTSIKARLAMFAPKPEVQKEPPSPIKLQSSVNKLKHMFEKA
jgi:hypothetical protein